MSVKRVGNGPRPWRARLRLGGRDYVQSFRTKVEAEEYEREERRKHASEKAGLVVRQGPVTYGALCDIYLASYTSRDNGAWLTRMLDHSRDRFGSVLVHTLRPEQIGAWIHSELDLAPKTKSHILTALRQVLNAGVEWGYLTRSPARRGAVRAVSSKHTDDVRPFESWNEVLAVAEAAGHYGPLIRFACATGLRPQEWCVLERRDIDKKAGVVHVRRTLSGGEVVDAGKTPGALRAVSLSKPALRALEDNVSRLDTRYVFSTESGTMIWRANFRNQVWKPALETAGIQYRPPYQMRHSYATLALQQGASIEWISRQMGHTNIEITLRHYARFTKLVDSKMVGLLDAMEGGTA